MSLIDFVCEICKSFMQYHPTLPGWIKCNCGFCKVEKETITLEKYFMGRDKQYPSEFTSEIEDNAKTLLRKVNMLFNELKIKEVTVNSGWRPVALNNTISNAAKKSNHTLALAVDLSDRDNILWNKLLENLDVLQRFGLYLEDRRYTPSWVHIQCIPPKSGKRIFIPSSSAPIAPHLWDGKYDSKFND